MRMEIKLSPLKTYIWRLQRDRTSHGRRSQRLSVPLRLTGLMDSLMFSHQPTWDDCQQLLRVLFTTKEKDRILLQARKNVPGDDGRPTQRPDQIDDLFPLKRPNWDPNSPDGSSPLTAYKRICGPS
ncbi:uncharacterized protein LOC111753915 isoform X3 [Cavia porcellus]|uniref:uncharacterized protein LOC111753915 isoform X3 n=1 Tax=Cavia porcellus TaxID=10141 RepID=UPI002FDF90A4